MLEIILFAASLILTAAGVAIFKRLGITAKLVDIPNERSSHRTPTIRGAGAVIVVVCLSLFVAASLALETPIDWAFMTGAVLVAAISWVDDIYSLSPSVRIVAHGVGAAILVFGTGYFSASYLPVIGSTINLAWFGPIFSIVWVVWMINAYNFMDGIDGIAGIQAVISGIGWSLLALSYGDSPVYLFGGVLAFSALGFLVHNWQPAEVFMGDVGSAFLGYTFAALPLLVQDRLAEPVGWLIPVALGVVWLFWMDTVYTFLRRLYRGEKFWQAHREHLYQRLVIAGSSHGRVSLLYAALGGAVIISLILAVRGDVVFEYIFPAACLISAAVVVILAHRKND